MTYATIQNSFTGGEISPSLFGRTDLSKWRNGASTMRNFFNNYRGGAASRAGQKYVLACRQSGNGVPPRPIPFQFNINQGYVLEFGDDTISTAVTGAADNGAGAIRLAVASTRGIWSGSSMIVSGVGGTTEANGTWVVTVINATHVDLVASTYMNAYTSGGTTSTSSGYMRVVSNGGYVTEATKVISGATQANPCVLTIATHGYAIGDWIYITGMTGMTNFDGLVWIVRTVPNANHVTLTDLFGNTVNSTLFNSYISGGTAARIYTIPSPYAAVDLPYLKFTQSSDTMSLTCVNQETDTDYPPYDLERNGATDWVFTAVTFASSIAAPANLVATPRNSTTVDTYYSYVVTAVDATTGEESIASSAASAHNNNISINAGSNSLTWDAVSGAGSYNVYAATPQYDAAVPSGVLYGFIGTSLGNNFVDSNIIADFTKVPPVHNNPFPSTMNYPGCVAYFQQRRAYANTLNNPDTYFMSQPGAFLNFDSSVPVSDGDSITGAPWAQQINGIQFMQPMTSGLMILTGNGAWYLTGGNNADVTPSDQTATAQAYNGCHTHVQPIVINFDILYVQAKGVIIRDLSFNFFANVWTGSDLTVLSNHLFAYRQIQQWAYAEEPYKLVWAVRDDGIMLSLTYLKEQDVYSWARHDTNGFFVGVAAVTEPPVDAVYTVTKRYISGESQWVYYMERMDNRNWQNAEDCFCVDAGLSYPMSFPDATLTPSGITGTVTFTASASVFTMANVGDVIRIGNNNASVVTDNGISNDGGGQATITSYVSGTEVIAEITQDITTIIPNNPDDMPIPAISGQWSLSTPTTTVTGLNHLEGMTVAILADGGVVQNQVVSDGSVTLPQAASAITIGLPYVCQLQTLYLEPPGDATVQGKRKNIYNVSVRVEATRGIQVGTNQPDQSVQPNNATIPWTDMTEVKERTALVNADSTIPLFTGDFYINLPGNWDTHGQVAVQQTYPLPANILAVITDYQVGDTQG